MEFVRCKSKNRVQSLLSIDDDAYLTLFGTFVSKFGGFSTYGKFQFTGLFKPQCEGSEIGSGGE